MPRPGSVRSRHCPRSQPAPRSGVGPTEASGAKHGPSTSAPRSGRTRTRTQPSSRPPGGPAPPTPRGPAARRHALRLGEAPRRPRLGGASRAAPLRPRGLSADRAPNPRADFLQGSRALRSLRRPRGGGRGQHRARGPGASALRRERGAHRHAGDRGDGVRRAAPRPVARAPQGRERGDPPSRPEKRPPILPCRRLGDVRLKIALTPARRRIGAWDRMLGHRARAGRECRDDGRRRALQHGALGDGLGRRALRRAAGADE